ncbi:hypothetical protein K439DRAFT_1625111 [Ramaria rubella]|nr:hypothetical protein K439DRAFT_1625111 [Ramaria rubella]
MVQPQPQPHQPAPPVQHIIVQNIPIPPHPKHDIHKFCDIKPQLKSKNWITWKHNLLTTDHDQGLYCMILGMYLYLVVNATTIQARRQIYTATNNTPVSKLKAKWDNRNNAAYNQIITCLTPELQCTINHTDKASLARKFLIDRFESHNLKLISVIQAKYENYQMVEGQQINSYIMTLTEYCVQLKEMGQDIEDSYHSSVLV